MKKLNKAFAVLTVLAMLATLFVAVPASAALIDDIKASQPTVDLIFTSDDAMEEVVDPDTLAAGDVFYAWPQFGGLETEGYIVQAAAFLTWDEAVVAPADDEGSEFEGADEFVSARVDSPDLDTSALQYKKSKKTGAYLCDDDNAVFYYDGSMIDETNIFGYEIYPGNNGDLTANKAGANNVFQNPTEDGTFTLYGFRFVKLDSGATGVTIAGQNKTLNGNPVAYADNLIPAAAYIVFSDMNTTLQEVQGASMATFDYLGIGSVDGKITDLSPADSGETPTEGPTEAPTDEPTEAPTEVPEAEGEVTGAKQASKSDKAFNQNAFFYEFETPTIPGEVTGLTATFQIPGKDAVQGDVTNVNLTGISNVALNIAAVIKNIPAGQEDTPVTTTYTLTYSVGGVEKTLQWSRTNSLN